MGDYLRLFCQITRYLRVSQSKACLILFIRLHLQVLILLNIRWDSKKADFTNMASFILQSYWYLPERKKVDNLLMVASWTKQRFCPNIFISRKSLHDMMAKEWKLFVREIVMYSAFRRTWKSLIYYRSNLINYLCFPNFRINWVKPKKFGFQWRRKLGEGGNRPVLELLSVLWGRKARRYELHMSFGTVWWLGTCNVFGLHVWSGEPWNI